MREHTAPVSWPADLKIGVPAGRTATFLAGTEVLR
jgi:hypothetical protein